MQRLYKQETSIFKKLHLTCESNMKQSTLGHTGLELKISGLVSVHQLSNPQFAQILLQSRRT